jgi:hypothetical protein
MEKVAKIEYRILYLLKLKGPQTAGELAKRFRLTQWRYDCTCVASPAMGWSSSSPNAGPSGDRSTFCGSANVLRRDSRKGTPSDAGIDRRGARNFRRGRSQTAARETDSATASCISGADARRAADSLGSRLRVLAAIQAGAGLHGLIFNAR